MESQAIVVGMSGATGLAVVRALAPSGVTCHVMHYETDAPGFATRLAIRHISPDWRTDGARFADHLVDLAASLSGEVRGSSDRPLASLFVCDDAALEACWEASGRLVACGVRPAFTFARRPAELLDKRVQARAAERAGVDAPATAWGDADDLVARADTFVCPVLVKPAVSHEGVQRIAGKAILCRSSSELTAALERTRDLDVMVQDFVPGGDDQLYTAGVFRGGDDTLVFTGRKLKQHPPTLGISRLSEAVAVPELAPGSLRLLEALEYEGIAQVEYKRDARDGTYRLMEVNFRPWTWMGLATACGVNLPLAAHHWATDRPRSPRGSATDTVSSAALPGNNGRRRRSRPIPIPPPALLQSGGRWIWVVPEVIHTTRDLARGVLPDPRLWSGLRAEAFFSRRDPVPFLRTASAPFERRLTVAKRGLRRALRGPAFAVNLVYLSALSRREPPVQRRRQGLPPGDRVLVLAPHPDDESIMCGAVLAASRRRGDDVRVVAVTNGAATRDRAGLDDPGGTRVAELHAAARELGISDVVVWDLPDGGLPATREELAGRIAAELRSFAPTDIYAPFPVDVHDDHVATALALADALATLGVADSTATVHGGFVQTIADPRWLTRIVPAFGDWRTKRRALAAHASRDPGIFTKPLQLSWLQPDCVLRPAEGFCDLPAAAYQRFARELENCGATAPGARTHSHPLFAVLEIEASRKRRDRVTATLRASLLADEGRT